MPKSAAFGSLRMKSGSCDRPSQPPKKPALRRTAGPFRGDVRHRHEGNDRRFGRPAQPDDRADRRVVGGPEDAAQLAPVVAGQAGVDGCPVRVVHAVVRRADQGAAVNLPRETAAGAR